jgi:hypothetical protein
MEVEAKVRFMGEIVTPPRPCSTWNESRGLSVAARQPSALGKNSQYD